MFAGDFDESILEKLKSWISYVIEPDEDSVCVLAICVWKQPFAARARRVPFLFCEWGLRLRVSGCVADCPAFIVKMFFETA